MIYIAPISIKESGRVRGWVMRGWHRYSNWIQHKFNVCLLEFVLFINIHTDHQLTNYSSRTT